MAPQTLVAHVGELELRCRHLASIYPHLLQPGSCYEWTGCSSAGRCWRYLSPESVMNSRGKKKKQMLTAATSLDGNLLEAIEVVPSTHTFHLVLCDMSK